jgi:hypothetical protein
MFQRSQAPAVGLAGAFYVAAQKSAAHMLGQNRLREVAGVQIGGLLYEAQPVNYIRRRHHPAHAHPRERNLRKAVDLYDQIRMIQLLER